MFSAKLEKGENVRAGDYTYATTLGKNYAVELRLLGTPDTTLS